MSTGTVPAGADTTLADAVWAVVLTTVWPERCEFGAEGIRACSSLF